MYRLFFVWLMTTCVTSCATGTLSVTSEPAGSTVTVSSATGAKRTIGETPLNIPIDEVFGPNDKSTRLVIEKPGMYRESVVMARSILPTRHSIRVNLTKIETVEIEKLVNEQCQKRQEMECNSVEPGAFAKLARGVAGVQSLIAQKQYKEAELKLMTLLNEFPNVPVLHTLMGNSKYLAKDFRGALASYSKSLKMDPDNVDTKNLVSKLEQMVLPVKKGGE